MSEGERDERIEDSDDFALPRSIFVPQRDPRKDLRETVDSVLSDKFMAFLSILLIPVILLPFFFVLPASTLDFFGIVDATVIFFFVVEYLAKLYLAKSRWEYFKAPWHLVDLAVVLLSFVSYLPFLGLQSRGSTALLLRLLRLPRALAVGGRTAGSRVRSTTTVQTTAEKPPETKIRQVGADLSTEHADLTLEDISRHLATPEQEWIDIHNITEAGVLRLSEMLRVAPRHFKVRQIDELYPRVDSVQRVSFIFLQSGELRYPQVEDSYLTVAHRGEVVVCAGPKIITTSPHGIDMFERALADSRMQLASHGFTASVLYGIFDSTLREYNSLFDEIEMEITKIGNTQRSKLPRDFLQRMYELNKVVVRLVANLVHFKEVLGVTISGRLALPDFDEDTIDEFKSLQDQTEYLNEIADDLVERLQTIIDLYINQSSFETNRILKILAVITALSIIPAAVSGILGTNLLDVPYTFELWQIVVAIVISMAFVFYCFVKLGWLRT